MTGSRITMASGSSYIVSAEDGQRILLSMLGTGANAQWVETTDGRKVFLALVLVESVQAIETIDPIEPAAPTLAATNGEMI
jgi:hypothetical protein